MENENNIEMSSIERDDRLDEISQVIVQMRSDAVQARKESGIEDVWMACEEAYLGIDDLNRGEFSNAKWSKPTSMQGPVTTSYAQNNGKRSTIFIPLTARYVDAAAAKLAEVILPIDDKPFSIKPEPIPDSVLNDMPPAMQDGQPVMGPNGPLPVAVVEQQKYAAMAESAKKAETRIYDWLVEANYPAEARKVIHDCARIGTGILKGPFPELRRDRAMSKQGGMIAMVIKEYIRPGVKWVDPWNFFPADGCGESIHDGDCCLERDYISERKLKKLKRNPIYLKDRIDRVIEEGPGKIYLESTTAKKQKKAYEIWYCYTSLKRDEMLLVNGSSLDGVDDDKEDIPAIVTLVNDTIISAVINPLDSGSYPYRVKPWSRRAGSWTGIGVAEKGTTPQKIINGASRALMNNGGSSSGVQFVIDQMGIIPADNSWDITPNKVWYKTGESNNASVAEAFQVHVIPSVQPQMQAIIQYGMQLMEEATGIPLVTQGYQGPSSPETFGQAQLQDNNSHTWIRSVGYSYDDCITEPLIKDFFEWLLIDPEVPQEEKGQFRVNASGSAAMIERAIQEQTLMMLLSASNNPGFNLDPSKLMEMILRAKRFDPRDVTLSEEEKQKRAQMQPPPPPQVMVEQVKGQNALQQIQAKGQVDMQVAAAQAQHEQEMLMQGGATPHQAQALARLEVAKIQAQSRINEATMRTNAELAYAEKEREISADNAAARLQEMQLKRDLAMLDYANKHQITLEQLKTELAKTQMQEETKRQLANAEIALNQSEAEKDRLHDMQRHALGIHSDQAIHRADLIEAQQPIEPAGKAEPGKAFSQ